MYTIIWEFRPAPQREAEFVATYTADGAWVKLFCRGAGYLGTELSPIAGRWYRTIDQWASEEDYRLFRRQFAGEYDALDRDCEALTMQEREVTTSASP